MSQNPWDPLEEDPELGAILVVEDEPGIRDFVKRGLEHRGYTITLAADGESGARMALAEAFDLIVLDVMLPGRSGLEVLTEVRAANPQVPVIVLTALADTADRIRGLDAGAVDYVVKPFSVAELAARIRAQLRSIKSVNTTRIAVGDVEIDLLSRKVWVADSPVHLSSTEFQLLAYFMQNAGMVLSRSQILRAIWGYDHDPVTNVVEVYIGYLRRKLRRGETELPLVTIRSVGYRLADET